MENEIQPEKEEKSEYEKAIAKLKGSPLAKFDLNKELPAAIEET